MPSSSRIAPRAIIASNASLEPEKPSGRGAGVSEDVGALERRVGGVDGDERRADRDQRPGAKRPLHPGSGEHCHALALADAEGEEARRELVDRSGHVLPRDIPPAVVLADEEGAPPQRAAAAVAQNSASVGSTRAAVTT